MKIPLLLHAAPRTFTRSASVYLPPGSWRIVSDHRDSTLLIANDPLNPEVIVPNMTVEGDHIYTIDFKVRGSESRITIMAELCRSP